MRLANLLYIVIKSAWALHKNTFVVVPAKIVRLVFFDVILGGVIFLYFLLYFIKTISERFQDIQINPESDLSWRFHRTYPKISVFQEVFTNMYLVYWLTPKIISHPHHFSPFQPDFRLCSLSQWYLLRETTLLSWKLFQIQTLPLLLFIAHLNHVKLMPSTCEIKQTFCIESGSNSPYFLSILSQDSFAFLMW